MFDISEDLAARMYLAAIMCHQAYNGDASLAGYSMSYTHVYKDGSDVIYRYANREDMRMFLCVKPNLVDSGEHITVEIPSSVNLLTRGFSMYSPNPNMRAYCMGEVYVTQSYKNFVCVDKQHLDDLLHAINLSLFDYIACSWDSFSSCLVKERSRSFTHLVLVNSNETDQKENFVKKLQGTGMAMDENRARILYTVLSQMDKEMPESFLRVANSLEEINMNRGNDLEIT